MAVRIFAWRVELVLMVGMFDRANPQPFIGKSPDQVYNERGLPVILPANDVHTLHKQYSLALGGFEGILHST